MITLVKTASKSDIRHGRTCPRAPMRWLSTGANAPHASSSPGWTDLTRIPDDPTHMTDPDKDDISMMSLCHQHIQLACRVELS